MMAVENMQVYTKVSFAKEHRTDSKRTANLRFGPHFEDSVYQDLARRREPCGFGQHSDNAPFIGSQVKGVRVPVHTL